MTAADDKPPSNVSAGEHQLAGRADADDVAAELRTAQFAVLRQDLADTNTAHPPVGYLLETGRLVLVKMPVKMKGLLAGKPAFPGVERAIRNEAAAFEVAKILGIEELVPVTVLRREPVGDGHIEVSVHEFISEAEHGASLDSIPTPIIRVAAAYDMVINQADRRGKNWMIVRDDEGEAHLFLYDHGFCFNWDPGDGEWASDWQPGEVRSSMVEEAEQRGVTPAYGILLPLLDQTNRKALEDLLEDDQLDQLIDRVRAATEAA